MGLGADVCRRDARNERFFFTYPVEKGYPRFCGGQASAALDLLDVGSVRGGKPKNNIQMRTRWIGLLKVIFQQQPLHLERRISSLEEFAPIDVADPVILLNAPAHQGIAAELSGGPLFGQAILQRNVSLIDIYPVVFALRPPLDAVLGPLGPDMVRLRFFVHQSGDELSPLRK